MIIKGIKQLLKKIKTKLPDKRNFIFKLIKKNSVCCEIGVWKGEFSQLIIKKNNPSKLYLIDPWKDFGEGYFDKKHIKYRQENQDQRFNLVNEKLKSNILKKQVEILKMTSEEALSKLENIKFDFIYVDGNHQYKFVKYDIENYFKLLNDSGYLVGDDYRIDSVKKAVDDFLQNNKTKNFFVKNDQFILQKY
tara:strand:+ start:2156 stop:2731 length:576 start_codon:yes stop_codon:yes gene_type:complete